MTTPSEMPLDQIFEEAICVHEAFMKMGFSPANIFFVFNKPNSVAVMLQEGDKKFVASIAETSVPCDEVNAKWLEKIRWYNETKYCFSAMNTERWYRSMVMRNTVSFVTALIANGFSPKPMAGGVA